MSEQNSNTELITKKDELGTLITSDELELAGKTAIKARDAAIKSLTPAEHIHKKEDYYYVDHKYTDDKFSRLFPIHEVEVVSERIFQNYWALCTVKITVWITPTIKISKVGSGGARIQIKSGAKKSFIEEGKALTPFDYIEVGNASKSALSNAVRNCQERFGVNSDITDRIYLNKEQRVELVETFNKLVEQIEDPQVQSKTKLNWVECKTDSEKLRFVIRLQTYLEK